MPFNNQNIISFLKITLLAWKNMAYNYFSGFSPLNIFFAFSLCGFRTSDLS